MFILTRRILWIGIMVFLAVVPAFVFAQEDAFTTYKNSTFSISVPGSMEAQEESESRVVFAADTLKIEVAAVSLPEEVQSVLQTLGDMDNNLPLVIQVAFAGSDYETGACAKSVVLPCVQFKDMSHSDGVLLRATLADSTGTSFYSITFSAPTEQALTQMQPDAVIASFQLVKAVVTESSGQEVLFNVVANQSVNVRKCASTDCELVGTTTAGQTLEVVGIENKWYIVKWENGTAYVASWLVARGPDVHVDDLSQGYIDPKTGCIVKLRTTRGDADFEVAIYGSKQGQAWVDIYRPGDSAPVEVFAQYDKKFIDTQEPYIDQFYPWGTYWPTGTYQVAVTVGNTSSMIAFDVNTSAQQIIYVNCE